MKNSYRVESSENSVTDIPAASLDFKKLKPEEFPTPEF
jgi:hypothetical protein